MPILPMLNAMSNNLVITSEEMTTIMSNMIAATITVTVIGYSVKMVKRIWS